MREGYVLSEVLKRGFEARCTGADGNRYLWHQGEGLRYEQPAGRTTLLITPDGLPSGPWFPTELGRRELAESGPSGSA
jgi:hypothetical protein